MLEYSVYLSAFFLANSLLHVQARALNRLRQSFESSASTTDAGILSIPTGTSGTFTTSLTASSSSGTIASISNVLNANATTSLSAPSTSLPNGTRTTAASTASATASSTSIPLGAHAAFGLPMIRTQKHGFYIGNVPDWSRQNPAVRASAPW